MIASIEILAIKAVKGVQRSVVVFWSIVVVYIVIHVALPRVGRGTSTPYNTCIVVVRTRLHVSKNSSKYRPNLRCWFLGPPSAAKRKMRRSLHFTKGQEMESDRHGRANGARHGGTGVRGYMDVHVQSVWSLLDYGRTTRTRLAPTSKSQHGLSVVLDSW